MVSVMRKSITNGDEIGHYYCDNNGDFDNKGRSIDRYKQKEREKQQQQKNATDTEETIIVYIIRL